MALAPEHSPEAISVIDTEPTNTPDKFSYKDATFEEVLEDLSSRFILNLPEDELAEVERVCFQVEQAHWYYEDFIREENPYFPSLPLKKFSEILFRSCPLLHHWSNDHETAFNGFMNYKTRVPVCGAIMLNDALTKCVLVKGWKSSAGWGFPKGKVNENEDEAFCAVREVLEETGYNLSGQTRRTDCIRLSIKQQPITLFVVAGIPEDFPFKTQTRKEISKIDWFKLVDLPTWKKNRSNANKFYLITPVIGPLKAIVRTLRKTRKAVNTQHETAQIAQTLSIPTDEQADADVDITVTVDSLVTVEREPSFQSQSVEAEISSSQSSSIDPHTPSVNGDLAPHTSDETLVVKHDFSADPDDIALVPNRGVQIEAVASSGITDPRTHWTRLMTRLNHSEENSRQGTPLSSTPTPPIPQSSPRPQSHSPNEPLPYQATVNGGSRVGSMNIEPFEVRLSDRPSKRQPTLARSSTVPGPPFRPPDLTGPTSSDQTPLSPDVIVKRTRQLQLLDSVVAEESARRTPQLPMSAHVLGAYPRPSSVVIPDQVRVPMRPASVNPQAVRSLAAPFHHHHKLSVPSLSGVLPSLALKSLQHQFNPQGRNPQHPIVTPGHSSVSNLSGGRPTTILPSLQNLSPAHQASILPTSPLALSHGSSVDSIHRGQMLSILTGGSSTIRPSPLATRGHASNHSSRGSFSSPTTPTSTVTSHPSASRSSNAHLLSILNNTSASGVQGRPTTLLHTRQGC